MTTAAWMAYAILVSGTLMGAAWALERGCRLHRRPTRFAWAGAILAALLLPATALVLPDLLPAGLASGLGGDGPAEAVVLAVQGLEEPASASGLDTSVALAVAWLLTTLVLLVRSAAGWLAVASRLRRATRHRVGRARLYLTAGMGPAVTGLPGGRLVLPEWIWTLSSRQRRLVLSHEREHLEAGDPWLLAGARLLVTLFPWNLPLWWGLRRLRLAVETDCDRRVLRAGADPGVYGDLLLYVGERSSRVVGVAALAERTSFLERRIDEMTRPRPRHRTPKTLLAGLVALAAVGVACESPAPGEDGASLTGQEASPAVQTKASTDRPPLTPHDVKPRLTNVDRVKKRLMEVYPDDLEKAGVGGTVVLWLHVDARGRVQEIRTQASSGVEALDEAAMEVAASMGFEPAAVDGSPSAVWIQQPISFRASGQPS